VDFPYGHTGHLRELEGKPADLTTEEQATIDALNAEQAKLEFEYQDADELPDEVDQRLGEIEAALMAFEERSIIYEPTDIARAGVFVSIDSEGRLSADRGYVRPEDEVPREDPEAGQGVDMSSSEGRRSGGPGVQRTAISVAGSAADTDDDDEDAARPLAGPPHH
jgi:ParB family chromosome partitioning protein